MIVNRSAPRATVVPVLVYQDVAKAIDFLRDTFGFRERLRVALPNGSVVHAQLDIGDATVMLGGQGAEFQAPPSETLTSSRTEKCARRPCRRR